MRLSYNFLIFEANNEFGEQPNKLSIFLQQTLLHL